MQGEGRYLWPDQQRQLLCLDYGGPGDVAYHDSVSGGQLGSGQPRSHYSPGDHAPSGPGEQDVALLSVVLWGDMHWNWQ